MSDPRRRWPWLVGGTAAAAVAGVAVAVHLSASRALTPDTPPEPARPEAAFESTSLPVPTDAVHTEARAAEFAGSAACRGCHSRQAAAHGRSGHSHTLRRVTAEAFGDLFTGVPPLSDEALGWRYLPRLAGGRPAVRCGRNGAAEDVPVDLAIGSGQHGITFVALRAGGGLVPRVSLYRNGDDLRWHWTPTVQPGSGDPLGVALPDTGVIACLSCHITSMRPSARAAPEHLGVGCERCHGPGRAHAEAMTRDPRTATPMPRLGGLDAHQVLALCNTCHRSVAGRDAEGVPKDLARAQPAALERSACFRKSSGRLSCVTCHDPHAPVRRDARHYERVCSGCHTGRPPGERACPVRTAGGCLGCHMTRERQRQFNDTLFMNHWIRRRPAPRSPAADAEAVLRAVAGGEG
jgi:hypothetical protein